jgi:hypothetical protein
MSIIAVSIIAVSFFAFSHTVATAPLVIDQSLPQTSTPTATATASATPTIHPTMIIPSTATPTTPSHSLSNPHPSLNMACCHR